MNDAKVEDKGTHEVIQPPTNLAAKLKVSGAEALTPSAFAKADKIITDMGVLYGEEARKDLARLQAAVDALDAHRDPGGDRLKAVMRVALDLKGQGASFGYDLITAVGAELCRFIDRIGALGDREMEGIRLHLDTLKLVLAKDLRGDGGEAGRELVDGLRRMVDKLSAGG
ncbi:MAG: hypothetical protein H6907_19350 [Hyphomicrobiales bacterium]|nr:hypothetical protein [Hyphomicrobiales bacterium]MCP5373894.1 hypothetical protein [Hyphomicrobiales bacterium]